jgi:phosphomannomutase
MFAVYFHSETEFDACREALRGIDGIGFAQIAYCGLEIFSSSAGKGRALLRQSGTEPVVRVMIESETQEQCVEYAEMIAKAITEGGHCVE